MSKFIPLIVLIVAMLNIAVVGQDSVTANIIYEPETGHMRVDTNLRDDIVFLWVTSQSGIFVGELAQGVYDQNVHRVHFARGGIYGTSLEMGNIAPKGLTTEFLLQDLCFDFIGVRENSVAIASLLGQPLPPHERSCEISPDPNGPGPPGPAVQTAVLNYNSATGNLSIDLGENARLTTLELTSPSGIFTGDPARNLGHVFDVDRDHKIFKLLPSGFGDTDFGNVVAKGRSNNEFVSDVCVAGSWAGGTSLTAEYQNPEVGRVPLSSTNGAMCNSNPIAVDLGVAYNPENGYFTVSVEQLEVDPIGAMDDVLLSTLEVKSKSGIFSGIPLGLGGPNDIYSSFRVVKHNPEGFTELVLGPVIRPGLSLDFIRDDISIDAVTLENNRLGEIKMTAVPEPQGLILTLIGGALVTTLRRRRDVQQT